MKRTQRHNIPAQKNAQQILTFYTKENIQILKKMYEEILFGFLAKTNLRNVIIYTLPRITNIKQNENFKCSKENMGQLQLSYTSAMILKLYKYFQVIFGII